MQEGEGWFMAEIDFTDNLYFVPYKFEKSNYLVKINYKDDI